jgi:UDP-N-acetyl-D-glucosamine dehydrogenase
MTKLLENTFRSVNIGLVNELALMCNKMNIDVWEVIDAASTKPFGFMPFYPGPGLGGHCLPVDPIYLSWKARTHGFEARFIELAAQVNSYMPHYVVDRIMEILNERKKPLKGSRVLIVGIAYKKDVNDVRESPALEIVSVLRNRGAIVCYHDPYVSKVNVNGEVLQSVPLTGKKVSGADCVAIVTDHRSIDYNLLVSNAALILDTRNALRDIKGKRDKIVKL